MRRSEPLRVGTAGWGIPSAQRGRFPCEGSALQRYALAAARKRCVDLPQVVFAEMVFPKQTPQQRGFDLVLLSEVAYYWDDGDLARAGEWLGTRVAPGGDILLVHWTGETDYPQTGDAAVQKLHAALFDKVDVVTEERHPGYRLDLWRRAP